MRNNPPFLKLHKRMLATATVLCLLTGAALSGCGSSSSDVTTSESEEEVSAAATVTTTDFSDSSISVSGIEGLSSDYFMGVDVSSILEVEAAGGVFYDTDGTEKDIFEILAAHGINTVRIRLWNDPYDEDGNSFGGGGNDLETDLEIARRATAAGLNICLDFHYSDFWADPSKQTIPREWADYTSDELRQVVYDYTYEVLEAFAAEGCLPVMVQTGNEINNGFLYPNGSTATYEAIYLASAMSAVKDIDDSILTVVHLANGATYSTISGIIDQLEALDVSFDVIGLSYYSYWHGSIDDFADCVTQLDANYDYKICVMEYSYGYTDDYNENSVNLMSSDDEEDGGYCVSVQGQASYIHDVNEVVASVDSGIGSFYWEPAWLPLAGTSWATEYAHSYLEEQGDGGGEGTVSWANQALFDFDGYALDSLYAYDMLWSDNVAEEEIISINVDLSCDVDISGSEGYDLPTSTTAFTTLDRWTSLAITWNEDELAAITEAGTYTITGTVVCGGVEYEVTAEINAYHDYLKNGSFDDTVVTSDVTDFSNIPNWSMSGTTGSYRVESKNSRSGSANLNIWCSSSFENTLEQTIANMEPGTYTLSVYARSAMEDYQYPSCYLYVTIDGESYTEEITWGSSWSEWVQTSLTFDITETTDITIGISSSGASGTWAHFDDFALAAVE